MWNLLSIQLPFFNFKSFTLSFFFASHPLFCRFLYPYKESTSALSHFIYLSVIDAVWL